MGLWPCEWIIKLLTGSCVWMAVTESSRQESLLLITGEYDAWASTRECCCVQVSRIIVRKNSAYEVWGSGALQT